MRKLSTITKMAFFTLAAIAMFIQACDDEHFDVKGTSENKVYISTQSWSAMGMPKNSYMFYILKTPTGNMISNADNIEASFAVQCTHAAYDDITVKLEIDNTLVPEGSTALPDNVVLTIDKSTLTIPKGSLISSDSITISMNPDYLSMLKADMTYMVPVKISSVTNSKSSSNLNAAYLVLSTTYSNCIDYAGSVTGTSADRTGWTATVGTEDQGVILFDGRSNTYYRSTTFPVTIDLDLGSVHSNITGFALSFSSANYSITAANVYSRTASASGYEFQGSVALSRSATQYVSFYEPINARYIRIEITSPYSSSYGLRLSEFYAYQHQE